jgi:nucleotide-binding universal stress UspA family protein
MIRRILVPVDGSDRARASIEYSCDLARKHRAKILLIHAVGANTRKNAVPVNTTKESFLRFDPKILEEAERMVMNKGLRSVQSIRAVVTPGGNYFEFVKEYNVDIIVV